MPTYQYAKLVNPLKGFEEADTSSQSQGFVPSGSYLVKELRENYPTENSDYACIVVPSMGDEDTWICIRWVGKKYATIISKTVEAANLIDFADDSYAVEEKGLVDLLVSFYNFGYDLDQARYPYPLSGFKAPQAPPNTNNCCTFVEALIVKAWENSIQNFKWSMDQHKQMMIYSADDFYSPVSCLINSDMAEAVQDDDQTPHPWTVIQGWRKQWTSGHTFIILDHHSETDRVLTLESNSAYKCDGVGYRMLGSLKDIKNPPENWHDNSALWTWERMKSVYNFRKQCILKITNRAWV